MPSLQPCAPATHRELVTAYLLAQAGLPFTLDLDDDGRPLATPVPALPAGPRTTN
jgi:hypothetical protein